MIRSLIAVAVLLSGAPASAADAPAPPAATRAWDEAAAGATRLFAGEGRVVIHKGERVVVTFDKDFHPMVQAVEPFSGDVMSTAHTAPAGALAFSLAADARSASVLKVENNLSTPVMYGAMLALPFGDSVALHPTSTCPVAAGVVAFERWENDVALIGLSPFTQPPAGARACEVLAAPPDDGRAKTAREI